MIVDVIKCFSSGEDPLFNFVVLLMYGEGSDGDTTFTDHSIYARALTAVGGVQHDTGQDVHGQSILFDGATDYITAADAVELRIITVGTSTSPTADFCLEAYVYLTTRSHINTIYNKQTASGTLNDYNMYVDTNGKLVYSMYGAGGVSGSFNLISTAVVPLNQIVHVAVTRVGTLVRLFIDGVLDNSATHTGTFGNTNAVLNIGHNGRTSGRDLEGWGNWFRFTHGAARYTATFTPPSTPLPAS
jgi:hypothetical protein